jgi:Ca-activated chloride channel family protein
MKKIQYILVLFLLLFSSKEIRAQKDSISLQRKARKLVRDGNNLYQQKKFTDASVAYQKALANNTKYNKATYNLGNALYQTKNFKEAVPQYELTARTAKDKFTKGAAYHNIGNAMLEGKQYQPAVDAFKNALRNNPNDDETRYNLAVAQQLLEKEKQDTKDDKNKEKNKDKKDDKDKKDKDGKEKDKKDGEDNKNKKEDKDKEGDKDSKDKNPKKGDKKDQKPKAQPGKMTPQQVKQLLESLNNEEKKTQKKMNAKKAKGKKIKQEKDW